MCVCVCRTGHLIEKGCDWVVTAIQDEQNGGNVLCEIKQFSLPSNTSLIPQEEREREREMVTHWIWCVCVDVTWSSSASLLHTLDAWEYL